VSLLIAAAVSGCIQALTKINTATKKDNRISLPFLVEKSHEPLVSPEGVRRL
jgi:hypothetical protein